MQVVSPAISANTDTQIYAVYDDSKVVPSESMQQGTILLRYVQSKYLVGVFPPILLQTWVEDLPNIAAQEGSRRVEVCYTAAQQRAAALIIQDNILQYGTDTTAWPASEQTRYLEIQRGLAFINSVHAAQQTIVTQSILNPCDDQYWPAPITPISL